MGDALGSVALCPSFSCSGHPGAPAQPTLPTVATMEPLFPASPLTTWNTSSVVPSGSGNENGTLAGLGPSPGARAVVVPVLYLLVCAVGLGGNALVIYVVLRHAKITSGGQSVGASASASVLPMNTQD